jgi:site-specific recombinase XerD
MQGRRRAGTVHYERGILNDLEVTRGNGAGSRNIRLAAIKSFMRYLRYLEYRVPSALEQIRCILSIPTKKTDVRLVRHLTAQEMQSILNAPNPVRRVGIRDRAMLHLCFAGGLRVSELVGVRVVDVRLQPQPNVLSPHAIAAGTHRAQHTAITAGISLFAA